MKKYSVRIPPKRGCSPILGGEETTAWSLGRQSLKVRLGEIKATVTKSRTEEPRTEDGFPSKGVGTGAS